METDIPTDIALQAGAGPALALLACPLLAFLLLLVFRKNTASGLIGTAFQAMAFVLALVVFNNVWLQDTVMGTSVQWLQVGKTTLRAGLLADRAAALMLVIVTFISLLVHIFSLSYMAADKGKSRYFAWLGLFTFSMLIIVLADSLLWLFIGWELVGFSSYLLIGFWYRKKAAAAASKKAFIMNRVGDLGFLAGLMLLWAQYGTLELDVLTTQIGAEKWVPLAVSFAGFGLFCGAIGKSAQFPLFTWLPDAMQGPTPVSALIHAATMVAAGVYLLFKVSFILTPPVLTIIAFTGALTAIMGAVAALYQNDIKKVLAYSTVSQLGYMVMGIGVGAYEAAMFHLTTHAFFKACLFLCAGAVIHALHRMEHDMEHAGHGLSRYNAQDMRLMGGLRKKLPLTFIAYTVSAAALAGLPLFSGFLSKDALLTGATGWAIRESEAGIALSWLVPVLGFASALLTALYMGKQWLLVFFGELRLPRTREALSVARGYINENPLTVTGPILLLALLSGFYVFSLNPIDSGRSWLMTGLTIPVGESQPSGAYHGPASGFFNFQLHTVVALISALLAFTGLFIAWRKYRPGSSFEEDYHRQKEQEGFFAGLGLNNWYLDRAYKLTLIKGTHALAMVSDFTDRVIINRWVDRFAVAQVVLAHISHWVDRTFIDGTVRGAAWVASRTGKHLRTYQSGNIQTYLITALVVILLVLVWVSL
ncbi:NADH-quinone oxidoreductase subunit L [Roseivirga sp. BDSF3-8]|uniref:NADH-quinone oxidoreductase subunit L n=1 Tax=Roseivirga sp. BDSF3-8 TaxID=3241598 RepID=UPI0035320706